MYAFFAASGFFFNPNIIKMKSKLYALSLIIFLVLLNFIVRADEGDTIVIQTIDFSTPVNPGWGAPREGIFEFPSQDVTYQKALMYYTLKCDNTQSPACGEWDYLTHTFLYQHTGVYDSTLYYHPNFIANGQTPDTLAYMHTKSWSYSPYREYSNETTPSGTYTYGQGDDSVIFPTVPVLDGKAIIIWTAGELQGLSVPAGEITGMSFYALNPSCVFHDFELRMSHTSIDEMNDESLPLGNYNTVFKKHAFEFESSGWNNIPFSFPFIWNGTSNIAVEISFNSISGTPFQMLADEMNINLMARSMQQDFVLEFENHDIVDIPVSSIDEIDEEITITCWIYGAAKQPQNDILFEAVNGNGNRVLNVHLPWSDSKVYWDAGWEDGGYDRISRTATANDFKDKWNHWAFTKNLNTGIMRIYLNGEFFMIGGSKNKPLAGIETFHIGGAGIVNSSDNFYDGKIDEFRVWNKELDEQTIKDWMHKSVNTSHPNFENLIAYYGFNEGEGLQTANQVNQSETANLIGFPQWKSYNGSERFSDFEFFTLRPMVIFESGDYDPNALDSLLVVDTIPKDVMMIVMFEDENNPTMPTDTLYKWPGYYNNYVYDENGMATDSSLVAADGILYRVDNPYYGEPFELLNRIELGRYITPYGNGLSLGDGWTWVYDVTDYAPLLHNSVHLTAGNFQELLDMDFVLIEGTPPRDVLTVENVYRGSHNYTSPESHNLPPVTLFVPDEASGARLKIRTTGHGFGGNLNCSEFCPRTNKILVNGEEKYTQYLWRNTCGENPLYPQGGTWLYDRAEWCPGAEVKTWDFEITDWIVPGDSVTVDYDLQDGYTWNGAGSTPYYYIESQFITYGDPNFSLDVEISDIIAPNSRHFYNRVNPVCATPIIKVKNNGTQNITQLKIEYGPVNREMLTYEWIGTLGFLEDLNIELDPIDWSGWYSGDNKFVATIVETNMVADENLSNNTLSVPFEITPEWPNMFVLKLKSNHAPNETSWTVTDDAGNVLFENDEMIANTVYEDTIDVADGCFNLRINDTGGDGLQYWANMPPNGNGTAGYARIFNLNGQLIHTFQADFGNFIQQSFSVGMALNAHENRDAGFIELYPNPGNGLVKLSFKLKEIQDIEVSVLDMMGNIVLLKSLPNCLDENISLDIRNQPAGAYYCLIKTREGIFTRKIMKVE